MGRVFFPPLGCVIQAGAAADLCLDGSVSELPTSYL